MLTCRTATQQQSLGLPTLPVLLQTTGLIEKPPDFEQMIAARMLSVPFRNQLDLMASNRGFAIACVVTATSAVWTRIHH